MRRLLCFLLLVLGGCAHSAASSEPEALSESAELVDTFELGDWLVQVYFEDPLRRVILDDPDFVGKTSREQATALSDYLHENVVYRFVVSSKEGGEIGGLILEGDPAITESAAFYRVVAYETINSRREWGEPARASVRGMLFEHMAPFQTPEGKQYVGNGIALFEGIFMRVTPYSEVKAALLPHLDRVTS